MVKKTVTYEDFNGNERTEDVYFHLNELELTELAADLPDEMVETAGENPTEETAAKALSSLGAKGILEFVKNLLLKSYGVKSADGRLFIKNEKVLDEFQYGGAFSAIVMELMTDDKAAADFVNNIIPAKLAAKLVDVKGGKIVDMPSTDASSK